MEPGKKKEAWASQLGVILAVTGSAVGLGNFLRFPGMAAQNGGGAFMIPYTCAFLLLGLPLAWVEWSLGRAGGSHGYNSAPGIFRKLWNNPISPYFGVFSLLTPIIIYMYYVYIEGWCLAYSVRYFFGMMDFGADSSRYEAFFSQFVGMANDGSVDALNGGDFFLSAFFFLIVGFALNFFLIYRGLTKGIEWFCRWAMPALLICALIILVRVLTLPPNPANPEQNVINGMGYMWNPSSPDKTLMMTLADPSAWMAAAGQIFFSLSVGYGIITTYASYMKKDDDIALSSLTASAGNGFCEVVLGGMITIPAAFIFLGISFVENPPSTFSMGFVALPNVFGQMIAGQFFGFLFFFLLFLAAVTSSLSMLQPAIAFLEEGIGLNRKSSVALLGFVTAIGSICVVHFSKDLKVLDTLDFWVGTFSIYILATFHVILFGWIIGIDRGMEELNRGAEIRIPRFVRFIIKYVAPAYLLIVFGSWLYQEIISPVTDPNKLSRLDEIRTLPAAQIGIVLIVVVAIFFLLLISLAVARWNSQDRKARVTQNLEDLL